MDERRLTVDAKLIFAEAMELPDDQREAYIARACGDRSDLRSFVERLLAANDQAGRFMHTPTGGGHPPAGTGSDQPVGADRSSSIRRRVGSFELVRRIGEGAFGEVYLANQLEPIRRDVAVKLLREGLDSRYVVSRFEAERQALAMLDHPNIARLLDAGTSDDGRPFFAMDLVRGTRITEHADANRLNLRERVRLLIGACRGVQHAHEAGLIHRDLKPANILVEVRDDRAIARVIDFGIARAVRSSIDATNQTLHGQVLGTPAYMSPEQARGGADVDSRADVYSLGCVLYELLTGTTPLEASELRGAPQGDLHRAIAERTLTLPSDRMQAMGDGVRAIARLRNVESSGIGRLLRGELDWICACALDRESQNRYATAGALADDLERWLDGRHITAAPKRQRVARARRLAIRNATRLRWTGGIAAVLALGFVWGAGWVPGVPGVRELMQRSVETYSSGQRYGLPRGAWVNGMSVNRAGGVYSLVGGGRDNRAGADHAVVGGGRGNIAAGDAATVGGGFQNHALDRHNSISGGFKNLTRGSSATVGGGESNTASAYASVVPGGMLNEASGYATFAAGAGAVASDFGSFVWSDKGDPNERYSDGDESQPSQGSRSFTARALGGFHLFTQYGTKALLRHGEGSWSHNLADESRVDREPVDSETVLDALAALQLETFRYHQQDATLADGEPIRHLAPGGEAFHAAFGLGIPDGHVTSADLDGVALAAIQGLIERLELQQRQIELQQSQLRTQSERIAELERRNAGG
ncbi:MAG: protein kinase [Phycisphaera sp.]|nr:MAG: protein kinase [Phycisphaera sp.]